MTDPAARATTAEARPKIGVVVGTTREGRFGDKPARWIGEVAAKRTDLEVEILDLRDYPLPFFDEPTAPLIAPPKNAVAQRWCRDLALLDGFIFITAEYNHGISAALKNALDHAYSELNRKPAAFVGYGGLGGTRAVEQLRLVCIELQMAPTRSSVHITREPIAAVRQGKELTDFPFLGEAAVQMLDELSWWTHTLRAGRRAALLDVRSRSAG
jgi:NAD(P)H-dependent FMN reductase